MAEIKQAGITPGNIVAFEINRRSKKRWGLCTRKPNGECVIQIAAILLEDDRVSEKACKDTIIHEILHSCKECSGHTGKWKQYAQKMNAMYGYNIKRTTSGAEKGLDDYEVSYRLRDKYVFRCKNCGAIVRRKKACKFTRYYRNYGCGRCGKFRAFERISEVGK